MEDVDTFRTFANSTDGWNIVYDKSDLKVWDRSAENSSINVVRLWTKVKDVAANVLYDVLHDPDYRKEWDENMVEGFCLQSLDPHNDVGYYCAKSPFFIIQGRDFCNQRSWFVQPDKSEFIIFNHSTPHERCPEKKGYTRAISFLTGYMVKPDKDDPKSCTLTYVTQADAKGLISAWAMNQATKRFAPKLAEKLGNVALKYDEWKGSHQPEHKPWLTSEPYPWEKKEEKEKKEKKNDAKK